MQFIVFRPLIRVNMLYVDLKMQSLDKVETVETVEKSGETHILHNLETVETVETVWMRPCCM